MKKLLVISLAAFMYVFYSSALAASEYETYQEIEFEHDGPVLLEQYTKTAYDKYYKRIKKRKFWGWKTYTRYKTEPVLYTKDTLYRIVNEGTTPITETFEFKTIETVKKQLSASGNIKMKGSGELYTIELGLEEELDWKVVTTTTDTFTEDIEIKLEVDPNTELFVEICGEGKISNGVAKYYRFWRESRKGGFEVFVVTTEYYSLRKVALDES